MTLAEFIKQHPRLKYDRADKTAVTLNGIDLEKLHQAINRSKWLQRAVRFSWLIKSYGEIAAGKYDDYPKRQEETHFKNERHYTKAQLDALITDDINNIEF